MKFLITLGTGLGSAMYMNGNLLPHLELSQHPIGEGFIYDNYIGKKVFEDLGKSVWNQRVEEVLSVIKNVFNYDHLYIGGGNSRFITLDVDQNITLVSNEDGIKGGAALWRRPSNLEISKEVNIKKNPTEVKLNNGN